LLRVKPHQGCHSVGRGRGGHFTSGVAARAGIIAFSCRKSEPPSSGWATWGGFTRRSTRKRSGASSSRSKRELAIFGIALLFGLIAMPFLIWFAGNRVLGPYTHGQSPRAGPFALAGDFLLGLLHGSAVFWIVALGPAVLLLLVRLFIALLRALPTARDT